MRERAIVVCAEHLREEMLMLMRLMAGLCALASVAVPPNALAQSAPDLKPVQTEPKTIGVPSNAKEEIVPSLIVMNSRGATLTGDKLTLTGVSPNVIIFADRPVRSAGHALTAHFLEEGDPVAGADSFAKDPPNATVSAFDKEASRVKDVVVELTSPKMEGADLTFTVKVLEGDLAGADGPASVFIDIIGMPRTPYSFAGAARRTAYRGAFYHPYYHPYAGAAAVGLGAAAVGAAAAGAYYRPYAPYYAPPPPCGYYPYPPCY
jgi:hypothetical protein